MPEPGFSNPTRSVSLDFREYLRQRQSELDRHMTGGIPDYAFSLDASIRSKLASVRLLRTIGQAVNAATVPIQRQMLLMNGVAVGPQQFPQIHALGEACARTLGIGIPQIFIVAESTPNAYTYCTNDIDQIIVLTSGLVESLKAEDELKFVIGHECGHIHNQHVVYNTIWELTVNPLAHGTLQAAIKLTPGLGAIAPLLQQLTNIALWYVFRRWHRCAEITSDRAGLICCGDRQAAMNALGKLTYGGIQALQGFNPEAYADQARRAEQSPLLFKALFQDHPSGPERVESLRLFAECEVFKFWRPEAQALAPYRGKPAVDAECENLVR